MPTYFGDVLSTSCFERLRRSAHLWRIILLFLHVYSSLTEELVIHVMVLRGILRPVGSATQIQRIRCMTAVEMDQLRYVTFCVDRISQPAGSNGGDALKLKILRRVQGGRSALLKTLRWETQILLGRSGYPTPKSDEYGFARRYGF